MLYNFNFTSAPGVCKEITSIPWWKTDENKVQCCNTFFSTDLVMYWNIYVLLYYVFEHLNITNEISWRPAPHGEWCCELGGSDAVGSVVRCWDGGGTGWDRGDIFKGGGAMPRSKPGYLSIFPTDEPNLLLLTLSACLENLGAWEKHQNAFDASTSEFCPEYVCMYFPQPKYVESSSNSALELSIQMSSNCVAIFLLLSAMQRSGGRQR
jgi:hypothetical protein